MAILEEAENHIRPAYIRSGVVISACAAVVGVLVGWVWLNEISSLMKSMLTGAVVFSALSAFIAGNTFRLRDIRARIGNQVRAGRLDKMTVLASLPPRESIAMRFRLARVGAILGGCVLLLALFYSYHEQVGVQVAAAVSILGILTSALTFVGGTVARPID
jgi:hypothetical protein